MGYTFTWDDLEKICLKLNMKRQRNTSVWAGVGSDGIQRKCTIHAKHKGNIGVGLVSKIAKQELKFDSVEDMYRFLKDS